jgi:hypothetical protein
MKRKFPLLGVLAVLGWTCFSLPGFSQGDSPSRFTIARIRYGGGGDWYSDPTSLPNLLAAARDRLGIDASREEKQISPADADFFKYPFAYLTGHGNVRFTEAEIDRLRTFLTSGGFLWCDDNGPDRDSLDQYFRREMKRVFPGRQLRQIPFDHPVFHIVYDFPDGPPKIHNHYANKPPRAYGLFHNGRLVVFYTWNSDIGDGLENPDVHKDPPAKREQALQMALNVVAYVLSY